MKKTANKKTGTNGHSYCGGNKGSSFTHQGTPTSGGSPIALWGVSPARGGVSPARRGVDATPGGGVAGSVLGSCGGVSPSAVVFVRVGPTPP